jgi:hypothetical protein
MEDPAEAPFVDELSWPASRPGRGGSCTRPCSALGFLDGLDHLSAFGAGSGQRFFAEDHLAGLGGGDGDFGVDVVGGADVDQVDVVAFDELAPVGFQDS